MKTAIIVLSDPNPKTEESLGRIFNALSAAYDCKQAGIETTLVFQGTGTRWPAELVKPDHPGHGLFNEVKSLIAGVSCGCADAFGATENAVAAGMDLIKDSPLPGTDGVASPAKLIQEGYSILTF